MTIQAEIVTAWMGIKIDKHESIKSIQYFLKTTKCEIEKYLVKVTNLQ